MNTPKTNAGSKRAPAGRASGQGASRAQPGARANSAARAGQGGTVEDAIAKAQQGRVNVSPAKAIEMAGQLYSRGEHRQAVRVCRQIIQARPANADAHNILGVSLAALGEAPEAVEELKRAIKLNPQASSYHANLGEILRQSGKLADAEQSLEAAVRLDANNAQSLNNLGIIRYEQKRFGEAIDYYRRAVESRPQMSEALNNLGNALRMTGDVDGAMQAYQDALTLRDIYPEAYNNLGTLLQQDRKLDEAEHALRKAIQQNPKYIEAHNNLAQLLHAQKKDVEALRILAEALKFAPTNVQTLLITARVQMRRNANDAAEGAARLALKQEPENSEALTILGQLMHETDRYEEALEVLEKALKHRPDSPEARNFYGVALKSMGRMDEARDNILRALKMNDSMYGAYANLNDLVDFSEGPGAELFDRMETIFETVSNPEADQYLPLHFAYAKALEDRGQHAKALEHYIVGGRMKRAQLDYKEPEIFSFFDSIRETFSKAVFENRKFAGIDDERPTFIVGMPRSGSTLVEQILSSHPDVYGAGEVKYLSRSLSLLRDRFPSLPKYPQLVEKAGPAQLEIVAKSYLQALTKGAGNAKRITDKLLTNYFFVGLVNLLYPNAKIIHTQRNPVDTCLSGFTKLFKDDMPHSYELGELGRYYGKYREIMNHWAQVLPEGALITVQYEDVVADTEKEARRLIDFLGLPWDDKCVDFHKSDRPVKTASVAQVRKPIYKTSLERWKKYGEGLQPLIDAIGVEQPKPSKAPKAAKATKAATTKKSKPKAKENA